MAKKAAVKRASRKKAMVETPLPAAPAFIPYDYNAPPPYPLPVSYNPQPVNPSDTMVSLDNIKSLYKSKNFWGAICLFLLSGLTLLGTVPALAGNPVIMSVTGMAFAVLWIVFRMMTNQPVTPTVNLPNPSTWFSKKKT